MTGGGGGIGRGISERFAAEGAAVVIAEIDADRARETQVAIASAGGRAIAVVVDVRDAGVAEALVTAARDEFGRVDVLVNNVGHFGGARKAFHEQTDEEWDDLYRVNLGHVLACSRAVLPVLIEQGDGGSIVNVSTIEAFRAIPTRAVYSAFKAAITGLTRSLAVEYGRDADPRQRDRPRRDRDAAGAVLALGRRPRTSTMIPAWVPIGRFGTADDTAGVALFLASDLSSFVTGTTVHADGGTLASSGWFPTEEGGWTNRPDARPLTRRAADASAGAW